MAFSYISGVHLTKRGGELVRRELEGPQDLGTVSGREGDWVVVYKDKIVATGDDIGKMIQAACDYPDEEVYITKILSAGASFY